MFALELFLPIIKKSSLTWVLWVKYKKALHKKKLIRQVDIISNNDIIVISNLIFKPKKLLDIWRLYKWKFQ